MKTFTKLGVIYKGANDSEYSDGYLIDIIKVYNDIRYIVVDSETGKINEFNLTNHLIVKLKDLED